MTASAGIGEGKASWRRRSGAALAAVGLAAAGLLAGGCATVEAWEKGNLAEPIMQAERDELESVMASHVYFSREASTGGEGVGGGGCGCN